MKTVLTEMLKMWLSSRCLIEVRFPYCACMYYKELKGVNIMEKQGILDIENIEKCSTVILQD